MFVYIRLPSNVTFHQYPHATTKKQEADSMRKLKIRATITTTLFHISLNFQKIEIVTYHNEYSFTDLQDNNSLFLYLEVEEVEQSKQKN